MVLEGWTHSGVLAGEFDDSEQMRKRCALWVDVALAIVHGLASLHDGLSRRSAQTQAHLPFCHCLRRWSSLHSQGPSRPGLVVTHDTDGFRDLGKSPLHEDFWLPFLGPQSFRFLPGN